MTQGAQELADIQKALDGLPAERNIPVRIVDEGTGTITDATKNVQGLDTALSDVQTRADDTTAAIDRSSSSIGRIGTSADDLSQHLGGVVGQYTSVGSASDEIATKTNALGGAFENTRSHLSNLTGGMAGFLPLIAGFSVVSALDQLGQFGHQVEITKDLMGGSAQQASLWTGAANDAGVSNRSLAMTIKGLQSNIDSLNVSMGKNVDQSQALQLAANNVGIAQAKYNDAVSKYGDSSTQAVAAQDTLIKDQDKYNQLLNSGSTVNNKFTAGLKDMGISLYNSNGKIKDTNTLLMEMADAYANSNDQAQTTQDILGVLGQRAYQILPLLAEGSSGIQQLMQQTASSGKEFNQQALDQAVATEKAMNSIQQDISGFMTSLAQQLTPVLDFVSQHINAFKDLALAIGSIFILKGTWDFGRGLIQDLSQAVSLTETLLNKLPGINIGGGASSSSTSSGIFGSALNDAQGLRVWWASPLPVSVIGEGGSTPVGGAGSEGEGAPSEAGGASAPLGVGLGAALTMGGLGILATSSAGPESTQAAIDQARAAQNIAKTADVTGDISHLWEALRTQTASVFSDQATNLLLTNDNIKGLTRVTGDTGQFASDIESAYQRHLLTTAPELQAVTAAWNTGVVNSQSMNAYLGEWNAVTKQYGSMNAAQQQQFNALFGDGITSVSSMVSVMGEVSAYAAKYGPPTSSELQQMAALAGFGVTDIDQVHNFLSGAVPAANSAAFNLQALAAQLGGSVSVAQQLRNAISSDVGNIGSIAGNEKGGLVGFEWGGILPHMPRAESGLPASSIPIVVGEAGPEVFMPAGAGEIIPNHRLQTLGGAGSGGGFYNFDLRGSQVFSPSDMDMLVEKMMGRFVRTTLPQAGVRITR